MSRLEDVLLTDGAQASLCARWVQQLKPDIDEGQGYKIAWYTAQNARNLSALYGVRIDPRTCIAIMAYETRGDKFNLNARGAAGEVGLWQILEWNPVWGDWRDPEVIILRGMMHYAVCLRAANGNERAALSRYNSGTATGGLGYADAVIGIREELK